MEQPVQVPTKEGIEAQLSQMIARRSQLKDEVEMIEKQMPTLTGMLQLLHAQEAAAQQTADAKAQEMASTPITKK